MFLDMVNKLLKSLPRRVLADQQRRRVGIDLHEPVEILKRQVGDAHPMHRVQFERRHQDRVPVGFGPRARGVADRTGTSGSVHHGERLAEGTLQLIRPITGNPVRAAASRPRANDRHRLIWIIASVGNGGQGGLRPTTGSGEDGEHKRRDASRQE